jgi:APA family basic amino acid/polyamine antiporter
MPDAERPYRVWGYPVLPYVAIGVTVLLLVAVYVENIQASLIGTAIVLAGLPVYYLTVYLRGESR